MRDGPFTKECKQEMEHLLTLVERQKQYRTGVVFPSRMNNYFYDAGTGKILRLQDEEYRLLKAIFSPQATVKTVMQAVSEEAPDKVEAFLRNTAQMNLLRMPPLETLCCDYHEDICQQIDHNLAQLILKLHSVAISAVNIAYTIRAMKATMIFPPPI